MKTISIKGTDSAIKKALTNEVATTIKIIGEPFYLRVRKERNIATWYLAGKKSKKLGKFPDISIKDLLARKGDIILNLAIHQQSSVNNFETVGQLLSWYQQRAKNDRSFSDERKESTEINIRLHLMPVLKDVKIVDINKHVIDEKFFQNQQTDGAAISSIKLRFSLLKKVFAQAEKLDLIEQNYLSNISMTNFTAHKIKPREGRLKQRHLNDVLGAISECKEIDVKLFNQFLLMHGTRRSETRRLKWSEVDFKNRQSCQSVEAASFNVSTNNFLM